MENTVAVRNVTLATASFADILSENGALIGGRRYVATQAGLTMESIEGKTFKEVSAMIGKPAEIKVWSAEYKTKQALFFQESKRVDALSAADPTMRSEVRAVFSTDKAGNKNLIGFNKKSRFIKMNSGSKALALENAELKARLAKLEAALLHG